MAGRMSRVVEVPTRAPDVASAVTMLRQRATGSLIRAGLRARVRSDGRFRARVTSTGRDVPPVLVGHITARPDGVVLSGTVRESRTALLIPIIFGGMSGFMALVFLALVFVGEFANPGLYICGTAAVAFAGISYGLQRARRFTFELHADVLEDAVRAASG